MKSSFLLTFLFVIAFVLSGCYRPEQITDDPLTLPAVDTEQVLTPTPETNVNEPTPVVETQPAATSQPEPIIEDTEEPKTKVFLNPGVPSLFDLEFTANNFVSVSDETDADLRISLDPIVSSDEINDSRIWVYVVVAPFYTITDGITYDDLLTLWEGKHDKASSFSQIYVTSATKAAMQTIFGSPDGSIVIESTLDEINSLSGGSDPILSILPFEDLNPQWKVLRVENQAPIDYEFDPLVYPLSFSIRIDGERDLIDFDLPYTNFDPDLRTVLVMTGVTALTRATAHQMEVQGNLFPAQDIHPWLSFADLTHISNEVPFASNCPPANPIQSNLVFCTSPDKIELLEFVGTNIIELSGNHMLDYGVDAMALTLEMYEERGWHTYAGGWDLEDSRSPALVTHNGNRLAFIGCNPVGPDYAWATQDQPGSAPCNNYGWLVEEVQRLRSNDYLPIVTFQYWEDYTDFPTSRMVRDFQMLAEAGAVVVNGSQAHTPKMMEFYEGTFLHYGLGNLFFDQMDYSRTMDEFIDRLVFYDGQLVSVELLTARLEDWARPRPMTITEREAFLKRIFSMATFIISER